MGLVLGDILRRHATVVPDAVAYVLRDGDERVEVSYGAFYDRAQRLAASLAAQGLGRGDRVAILMRNHVEMPIAWFALLALGAIAVPLNFRLTARELARTIDRSRPKCVLVEGGTVDLAGQALAGSRVFGAAGDPARLVRVLGDPIEGGENGGRFVPVRDVVEETDPFAIFYTSGTTGEPKGVVQNHRAYHLQTGQPVFSDRGTGEGDVGLCMFQLFHTSGWRTCLIFWRARARVVILRHADPRGVLEAIEQEGVTQFMGLPETLRKTSDLAAAERFDLRSLRELNTGTSKIDAADVERFTRAFGVSGLRIHYGASECGPVTTLGERDSLARPTSIGRPVPHVEVELVDEAGARVAPGETGELRVRSEYLMAGYDDPEATARAMRDGWYHTGDLAREDAEGFLEIVGRVTERIRSAGETIHPREVEDVVEELAGVAECVALGVPDPEWGEVVLAVIVREAGSGLGAEAVRSHCAARLAGYKCPRHVRFVDALPRTVATDKVRKHALRKSFEDGTL